MMLMYQFEKFYQNKVINNKQMQKYLRQYELCITHNQPLDLVCMDIDCQNRGIICSYCQFQSHKHPVRSVSLLIKQIKKDYDASQSNMITLSKIDEVYSQAIDQLAKVSNIADRKNLQQTINNYYQDLCQSLNKKQTQAHKLLNNQIKTLNQLNSFFLKYQFASKEQNVNNLGNFEYFLVCRLEAFETNLKQLKEGIANQQPFNKILTIFTIQDLKRIKYWFNSQKMHKQIILVDSSNVKIKDGYSYRIAVLDPPIRKQNGKTLKKSCSFKIGTIGAMIGVGICYKKKAESLSYIFSAYSQHGCYFIANNGYTYNESEKTYNSQIKNWTFASQDIIKVTIHPKQKKISFKKQGVDPFQYPYNEKPEFQLNFAVMMCSNNESVEVIHA